MEHRSVLLQESIDSLNIREDGIYVDGTLGRAGHSSEILKRLTSGHLYCFDIDQEAIEKSDIILKKISDNYTIIKANFVFIKDRLNQLGVEKVDGILLDIGVSSPQFDDPERGFSYRYDSRLDMRMDQSQSLDAYKVINEYEFNELVRILRNYGEEKFAKEIARAIEKERTLAPIETTGQLVDIIKSALPARVLRKKGHPAKQSFQALRIEVNNELENLKIATEKALELLKPRGRCAIITFHSLEDEIVKKIFKEAALPPVTDKRIPLKADEIPQSEYQLVNKKVITASKEELDENRRAQSAKLRVIERR
ncbi:MAG TPA: 16S rRNA (cytosine(1402)-N(4))-methyltransferase RsmH [Erysipelotrichaceae bacterium]|nr:16S rRNA (cytosine(1402)-N(4))-methyltransferase RsmH [Erysipelotrichaceae bacterium]HQB32715.1 16S rRNA (cytosine(1402)-N(4))-methyltransferase RsmH [Erysipelotrichaceae bacterium]